MQMVAISNVFLIDAIGKDPSGSVSVGQDIDEIIQKLSAKAFDMFVGILAHKLHLAHMALAHNLKE